jgi:hypothetical protein
MTAMTVRLHAIDLIIEDVLTQGGSVKDERIQPELRDVQRLARGHRPRTDVGRDIYAKAGGV